MKLPVAFLFGLLCVITRNNKVSGTLTQASRVTITVRAGETAVLPCSIEDPDNYKVVWTDQWLTLLTLEDRRVIDDARISIGRPSYHDYELHIENVMSTDEGSYTCYVNTYPITKSTVRLNVQENTDYERFT